MEEPERRLMYVEKEFSRIRTISDCDVVRANPCNP